MPAIEIPATQMTAFIICYSAWETLKTVGITDLVKSNLFGRRSVLTSEETGMLKNQLEQCSSCTNLQEKFLEAVHRQNEILGKIYEAIIKVEVRTDIGRRGP